MLAHVADAVENTHLEVMIRTFALFFALRFPMATILSLEKAYLDLKEFTVSYGTVFCLGPGVGEWKQT